MDEGTKTETVSLIIYIFLIYHHKKMVPHLEFILAELSKIAINGVDHVFGD